MSKHTPGPLEVRQSQSDKYTADDIFEAVDGAPEIVWNGGVPIAFLAVDSRQDANARLIAAAPDLLEALELLLDKIGTVVWHDDYSAEMARAAIARAKGE